MKKEYLIDILEGKRISDVRSYKSIVLNEKIALIDSKTNKIYAYAYIQTEDIISYKEYILWHISDSYSEEEAMAYYEMTHKNASKIYYRYIFEKVELVAKPYKEKCNTIFGSWVSIDEDLNNLFSENGGAL